MTSTQKPKNKLHFGQEQTCTNRASNCASFGVGTVLKACNSAYKRMNGDSEKLRELTVRLKKMRGLGQNFRPPVKISVRKTAIISVRKTDHHFSGSFQQDQLPSYGIDER